jgi:hypothetical protein
MTAMKHYVRSITTRVEIPEELARQWNEMLERMEAVPDAEDIIDSIDIDLGDDLEVEIKLCNGSERKSEHDDCGPYLDCILFKDGSEIDLLQPGEGPIEGEYTFVTALEEDGVSRSLTVEVEIAIA